MEDRRETTATVEPRIVIPELDGVSFTAAAARRVAKALNAAAARSDASMVERYITGRDDEPDVIDDYWCDTREPKPDERCSCGRLATMAYLAGNGGVVIELPRCRGRHGMWIM